LNERSSLLPSASDLMRSLGLLVDGPAQWSRPVHSRAAGVFVVELPGGLEEAPIDIVAVRRWLERVPDLRLDGELPTPQELGRRLATFWLPGEPILFVGRSAQSVGQRVAAMYATPLGDVRPYSAPYWLKTLSALSGLRVWWAETDAHEEYLDALLAAVGERNDPPVGAPAEERPLPFANLVSTAGVARQHGLTDALLQADPLTASPTAAVRRPVAAARRRTAAAPRSRAPTTSTKRRSSNETRPVPEPTLLSQAGIDRLTAELDELRDKVRPQVIARVKAARELGDLRENADYDYARKEQSFVEGRIQTLEAMIKSAMLIDTSPAASDAVRVGSTVVVATDDEEITYVLVGSAESDPAAGRISYSSPVGRALLGARAGDEVEAQLPGGVVRYRVREVR
jgi:transcription elongation factor GreA